MCLIFVAHRVVPGLRLVAAANRDEFHARAAAPAGRWPGHPQIIAGRDLEAGGTWLGLAEGGRFAALTNYREGQPRPAGARSRGDLVAGFLGGAAGARDWCEAAADEGASYGGFNLFALEPDDPLLWWCSNRAERPRGLGTGVYGLSNHLLDTPWPKVSNGKQRFVQALSRGGDRPRLVADLFALLAERAVAADAALPDTGVGMERERALASAFILGETYGTRCSSVVLLDEHGGGTLLERSFDAAGAATGEVSLALAETVHAQVARC